MGRTPKNAVWIRDRAGRPLLAVLVVLSCSLTVFGASGATAATTGNVDVTLDVANALSLNLTACPSATANISDFGTVVASGPTTTTADCGIGFSSTLDTAALRVFQQDQGGETMRPRPTADEVMYVPLNGSYDNQALDSIGLPPIGAAAPNDPAFAPGKAELGDALDFDGNDWAVVGATSNLQRTYTFDMWVNLRTFGPGARQMLFQRGAFGTNTLEFFIDNATQSLRLRNRDDYWGTATWEISTGAGDLANGQWHHVGFSYDATGTPDVGARMYVDGQLRTAGGPLGADTPNLEGTWPILVGNSRMQYGCGASAPAYLCGDYIDGRIDEVRLSHAVRPASYFSLMATGRVRDFSSATNNWTSGNAVFGACLRSTVGGSVLPTWAVDGNGTCTPADTDPWYGIPAVSGAAGSKIAATTVGGATGTANLRYGVRVTSSVTAGTYRAPIGFEVITPDV